MVANWVKKQHKIDENSSIVFKWKILAKESTIKEQQKAEQTLYCLKVVKICKDWQNVGQANYSKERHKIYIDI